MNDTPQKVKDEHLKIWLSKPPMERLRQMMQNNAMLYKFWSNTQRSDKSQEHRPTTHILKKPSD
jgi:hypothetical protein